MMRHLSALYPLNGMVGNQPAIQQLLRKWYPLGIPMEYQFGMQPDSVTGLLGKTNPPPLNSLPIYPFIGPRISHNGYPATNTETQQLPFGSTVKVPQEPSLIKRPDDDKDQMFWNHNEVGENAPREYNGNIQSRRDNGVSPDPSISAGPSFEPLEQMSKASYISPNLNSLDPKFDAAKELNILPNKTNQLNPILFQDPTNLSKPQENQSSTLSGGSEITEPNKSFEYEIGNTSQRPSDEHPSAIVDYSKDIKVTTSDSSKLLHQPEQNSQDNKTVNQDNFKDSKDPETVLAHTEQNSANNETSGVIRYYPASARSPNTPSDHPSTLEQPGQHNPTPSNQFANYQTLAFGKPNRSKATSESSSNEPTDTKLHESAGTKYYEPTVQRYDTPESAQYNPDYNQLGERITMGSTPVRGYVDQTYGTRTPGGSPDPIALSSSNDVNRPFDQRIVSLNPSSRFTSEREFNDQKSLDPSYGNTPNSASHITYYQRTMPGSIPYPGLTASERSVSGSDKLPQPIGNKIPDTPYLTEKYTLSKSPTLISNQKIDSPELNSEEQIDEDGAIRHYGKVHHTTKGYITYYPSNIKTDRIIGSGLPSDQRYVYTVNNRAVPGGDSSLSTPRILSETITKVHSLPIGESSQVSTTDESGDNAPKLVMSEGDQHLPSSALNGSTTRSLSSTNRFMNSVDLESPNEISLPEDSNAERLQAKFAAVGESAIGSSGIKMVTASQSQGSSKMAYSSYPASSFNTHHSMTPIQYISKPVTTQVRYSIVPATYRSASGAQIGPVVTSQALNGLKPMIPMMLTLPKGKRGVVTRGKYSYTGPDGKTVTTNWYVDETGFHVEDNQSTTTEAPKTS
uniref:Larval cuticle protein 16/17 n=1 Tax=Lygus hesperus TaxID=30085 RepID=A0A0A9Z9L6_LYGHE